MDNFFKKNWEILLIIFVALILFYKPLFSNQPLGLDAIGHLSKVSYLKEFPFANWDMSWYSGSLFLKLYPPLFYYVVAIFPNVFFGANLLCFLSLLFTSIGIFYLLDYLTKNKKTSLFSSLSFLTLLSLSYYWIVTANLPYFSALWTIPFSLYFLEKSIREKKKKFFVFFSLIFFIAIITHVLVGFLIGLSVAIRFLFEKFNLKSFKKILIYGGIPFLLSCFWFIPFLIFSNSQGGYSGQIPTLLQLFGIGSFSGWGFHAGGIGLVFLIFIFVLFLFLIKPFKIIKYLRYSLLLSFILGFLFFGGLGQHYPYGVDSIRFVLPFSVFLIICNGLFIHQKNFFSKKWVFALFIFILILGIFWNFLYINKNFQTFSYYKEDSRFGIFSSVLKVGLPFENGFDNYRFGTSKFVFGETLNYFMPLVPQTFGYQDAGMLNAPRYYDMRWNIWLSDNLEDSIYWLNWFAIKYFEVENSDVSGKFINDSRFVQVFNYSRDYSFTLYEYVDAKPIVSLVDYFDNNLTANMKKFQFERKTPDKIKITYEDIDEDDVVLFKEFYHKNWGAKDITSDKNLKIKKVGPGFMAVYPEPDSKGVIFYYKKNFLGYLSLLLSLFGLFLLWKVKVESNQGNV